MGIRFACHVCQKQLNIKRDLAGRRGVCPQCQSRFRIPMEDSEQSTQVDAVRIVQPATASSSGQGGTAVMAENDVVSQAAVSTPSVSEPRVPVADVPAPHQQSQQEAGARNIAAGSILDEEPDATWYVRPPSGGQYGPASTDELREWIGQGRVAASALLWRDGWPQWRDAGEALPELSGKLPGTVGNAGHVTSSPANSVLQVDSGMPQAQGKKTSISFSGDTGIGAERRSRTMRRISLIVILVAIAALLIGVLVYAINR
ncbi:DUF4339 domain-containing protein [bacterium]|nr:DUF4339 domain-containing protein [bacterium]